MSSLHTVFHSSYTNLYWHQQCTKFPFYQHAHQHFLLSYNNSCSNRCEVIPLYLLVIYFLLWKKVYLVPLPFKSDYLGGVFYWMSYLYIWILTPYQIYDLQIFSAIQWVSFSYYWLFPSLWKSFLVWCSPTCLFLLLLLLVSDSKNHLSWPV